MSVLTLSPVGRETLDEPGVPPAIVRATLRDIALCNVLFGGNAAAAYGLEQLLEQAGSAGALRMLDVGAGSGDTLRLLQGRLNRNGRISGSPIAVEIDPTAARVCREGGIPCVLGDAGVLPLPDGAVDVALASQLLHHLDQSSRRRLLLELSRVARVGVVVSDILRHRAAAISIWLASYPLRFHRVTRGDAVTSIRRGFKEAELAQLLESVGIAATVRRRPWFRITAWWTV